MPPLTEQRAARVLLGRTGQALLWFWLLLGLLLLLPGPLRSRLRHRPAEAEAPAAGGVPGLPTPTRPTGAPALPAAGVESIQDPKGGMALFYRALARTAAREPGAITRVLHYGDSLIDQDYITGALRQRLQRRYGDGGHGFVLAAKPWRWYSHSGVGLSEQAEGWERFRLVGGKRRDGRLGLGCAAAEPRGGRAWVQLQLAGLVAERLQLFFLRGPGAGELELLLDGSSAAKLSAASPEVSSGLHVLEPTRSPQQLRLVVEGKVRLFGVALERRGPGITWENLALLAARLHELDGMEARHWGEQLAARQPHLVVIQFGANDTMSYGGDLPAYARRVARAIAKLHAAAPFASCLVVGPLDRLVRDENDGLHSPAVVRRVSQVQRQAALDGGCAFWDGQAAMGGPGSMRRWLREGLAVTDMVHLSGRGSQLFAELLDRALEQGFQKHRREAGARDHAVH